MAKAKNNKSDPPVGQELEVSDRELAAILGGKSPIRKWVLISLAAGTALIAAAFIFWGGGWENIEGKFASAEPETINTDSLKINAERHVASNIADEYLNKPLEADSKTTPGKGFELPKDSSLKKKVSLEPIAPGQMPRDSALSLNIGGISSDTAVFTSDEEFYKMLNAEVSAEELSLLDGQELDDLLCTPLIPTKYQIQAGAREIGALLSGVSVTAIKPAPLPEDTVRKTAPTVFIDSVQFKAKLDSLQTQMALLKKELDASSRNNLQLEIKLQRLSAASDSLRQRDIKKLAKILETMTPEAAAMALRDLSSEEMSDILFKLKPRQAAKIIQQLPPAVSGEITAKVARR